MTAEITLPPDNGELILFSYQQKIVPDNNVKSILRKVGGFEEEMLKKITLPHT